VNAETRQELIAHVQNGGAVQWGNAPEIGASTERVTELLQLIVSLRDYQYA
jgi:hypothetical protein